MLAKRKGLHIVEAPDSGRVVLKIRKNMSIEELSNSKLLLVHAKLHVAYNSPPRGWELWDVVKLHSSIVGQMKKNNIVHMEYDELDEIQEIIEEEEVGEKNEHKG